MPIIKSIQVTNFGYLLEHKIKALLDTDEIVTYYPNTKALSVHSNTKGGLGRFLLADYKYPEIIEDMTKAYNESLKPAY